MNGRTARRLAVVALAAIGILAASCTVTPTPPKPPDKIVEAGGAHSCVIDQNRQVACWGDNTKGQLGIGTFVDSLTPRFVPGMGQATSISTSHEHTCAVNSGMVYCWGSNADGQLGDGTTVDRPTPVRVGDLTGVTSVVTSFAHSCALRAGGSVVCWGDNAEGQLGDGSTTDSTAPVAVTGLAAKSISARGWHTCAITTASQVRCWGENAQGQLGNGGVADSSVPVAPTGITTATAVEAGSMHTCARVGGGVKCWGNNGTGQLGNGTTASSKVPVDVLGISGVQFLATGSFHNCAIVAGGGASCWGINGAGQLGNGSAINSSIPVAVVGLNAVTNISAGLGHTCGVVIGSQVMCWGDNSQGQLGSTSAGSGSLVPVAVAPSSAAPPVVPVENISTVSNYDLNCQAYLGATPVQNHFLPQETSVSHPEGVTNGQTFRVIVSYADVDVPTTHTGLNLESMSQFSIRVAIPSTVDVVSATYLPGINIGSGTPTVTDHGTYVELSVPGPFAPGTVVTLPSIDLELKATGTSGQSIDLITPGTSWSDWGYRFNVTPAGIGNVANQCFVNPSPILAGIPIL